MPDKAINPSIPGKGLRRIITVAARSNLTSPCWGSTQTTPPVDEATGRTALPYTPGLNISIDREDLKSTGEGAAHRDLSQPYRRSDQRLPIFEAIVWGSLD